MSQYETPPTTLRHKVGMCPACRDYLWADVDVAARVSTPTLTDDGKAHVFASTEFRGMRVEHECRRDDDGEWVVKGEDPR